jgi:glutathione S-transferase
MKLYTYVGSGNGYKVELLCSLLGRTYERIEISIFAGEGQTPAFLAKNPVGSIPVLELDDGAAGGATCLPESNAILVHLARGTTWWPEAAAAQDRVLRWLMFEQSEVEPVIGSARFWRLTGRERERHHEFARRLEWSKKTLRILDGELATRPWLAGDAPTVADLAVYAYSHLAGDLDLQLGPAMSRWCARIEALPGFIAGPGPYDRLAQV